MSHWAAVEHDWFISTTQVWTEPNMAKHWNLGVYNAVVQWFDKVIQCSVTLLQKANKMDKKQNIQHTYCDQTK